jgi:hypothetical protein
MSSASCVAKTWSMNECCQTETQVKIVVFISGGSHSNFNSDSESAWYYFPSRLIQHVSCASKVDQIKVPDSQHVLLLGV